MFKAVNGGKLPMKGSEFSACVDLYSRKNVVIGAGETVLVPLGVSIDLDKLKQISDKDMENTFGMSFDEIPKIDGDEGDIYFDNFLKSHQLNLHIRSSMSAKHGLIIANGTGVIDMDYDGEIIICLHKPWDGEYANQDFLNQHGFLKCDAIKKKYTIKKGDRIAQISLSEHKSYLFDIETTDKRIGGFGSTDDQKSNTSN